MTIQDFNEALSERKSAQHEFFEELRQPQVREALGVINGTNGRWLEWG